MQVLVKRQYKDQIWYDTEETEIKTMGKTHEVKRTKPSGDTREDRQDNK